MDRNRRDSTKRRKRNLAGSVDVDMDFMGSAIPKSMSMARNTGIDGRPGVAGDRWSSVYRYGIGRYRAGVDRLGIQCDQRRPFWQRRCHGDLVSGALSGLWYGVIYLDVGATYRFCGVSVPIMETEKVKKSVHPLYPLSDDGNVDPDGVKISRRRRKKDGRSRYLRGSFTIEAALLVPLILGVLCLLLQTVIALHDTVRQEAVSNQQQCEMEERSPWRFVKIAGAIVEEWEEWKS